MPGIVSWLLRCAPDAEDEAVPVYLSLSLWQPSPAGEPSGQSQPDRPAMAAMLLRLSPAQQMTLSFFRLKTAQDGVKYIVAAAAAGIFMSCFMLKPHPPLLVSRPPAAINASPLFHLLQEFHSVGAG